MMKLTNLGFRKINAAEAADQRLRVALQFDKDHPRSDKTPSPPIEKRKPGRPKRLRLPADESSSLSSTSSSTSSSTTSDENQPKPKRQNRYPVVLISIHF